MSWISITKYPTNKSSITNAKIKVFLRQLLLSPTNEEDNCQTFQTQKGSGLPKLNTHTAEAHNIYWKHAHVQLYILNNWRSLLHGAATYIAWNAWINELLIFFQFIINNVRSFIWDLDPYIYAWHGDGMGKERDTVRSKN